MRNFFVLLAALMGSISTVAGAENLGPGDPDVVMECQYDGKPAEVCEFQCATAMDKGGGSYNNVSRVEFYHKGETGRVDGRTWVFFTSKPGPSSSPPNIISLYIGPRVFCSGAITVIDGLGKKVGFKITKFRFQ